MRALSILLLLAAGLSAAPATGPAVGTRALPFQLIDQNGKSHTLDSVLGPKGAILVFFRSADW